MDEKLSRIVNSINTFAALDQFEDNARRRNALSEDVKVAISNQATKLGRAELAVGAGLDLSNLSLVEDRIANAAAEYIALKKRAGRPATRTISQIKNRGLIGAAEASVSRKTSPQGYTELVDAELEDLTYEKIVVDNPEAFSPRAIWFARRTLGLPNLSSKAPSDGADLTQTRTETILEWLKHATASAGGRLPQFSNNDTAGLLGLEDMNRYGRVIGNIQSRIDFACYRAGMPPLGLGADGPFADAWSQANRDWAFPKEAMTAATKARIWRPSDFDLIISQTRGLPGLAYVSWNDELDNHGLEVKEWAFGVNESSSPHESDIQTTLAGRNPNWSRAELILALDLYLRFKHAPLSKNSHEVAELSVFLGKLHRVADTEGATYRNVNGVYMKMMNFRRFDPAFKSDGKVGLTRGNKEEESVWEEFSDDPVALAAAVAVIRSGVDVGASPETRDDIMLASNKSEVPYWVFVCNPKKWAIDRFLDRRVERDSWGVRPSDANRFAPGQLGIVRVGVDRRNVAERAGAPLLEPGIYALCEVESRAFPAAGANDEFWAPGEARAPGWPTVQLRYLRTYMHAPLTIERLREEAPTLYPPLLKGLQAATFPISADDFHTVMNLLGDDPGELLSSTEGNEIDAGRLAALEEKYLHAAPEVKEKVGKSVERGPIGALVKARTGYKCQVCEALGQNPIGFLKTNGQPYVEAHHVMPVASGEVGSLSASNVMTLCANHHRQMHYGGIKPLITPKSFEFSIDGKAIVIPRLAIETAKDEPANAA